MSSNFRVIAAPLSDAESLNFNFVTVKSNDGVSFAVAKVLIMKSKLVSKMLEDTDASAPVELPVEASKETLDRVFEFLDYHNTTPMKPIQKPIRGSFKDIVDEFDWHYFQTRLLDGGDDRKT